jgi:hypothetical protein
MLRALAILLFTAAFGIALIYSSAPWQQVDPHDPTVIQRSLGYHPAWSHAFDKTPGAQIDSDQIDLYLIVIVILAIGAGVLAYIVLGPPWWRDPRRRADHYPGIDHPVLNSTSRSTRLRSRNPPR